jgi:hypothetical protein
MLEQHFVTFFSPGTFVHEQTTKPIESWDVDKAVNMARGITERYNATPFGFRFSTRRREDHELDSRVVSRSGLYFLGGTVLTLEQVKARNDSADRTLIANMEGNGWDRIVENCNSWKVVQPLMADDTVREFAVDRSA